MKITVMAVVSFENVRKGDMGTVDLTGRIKALLDRGYLREVETVGEIPSGPGGSSEGSEGSSPKRVGRRRTADVEPSEDSDSGEHGETEVV